MRKLLLVLLVNVAKLQISNLCVRVPPPPTDTSIPQLSCCLCSYLRLGVRMRKTIDVEPTDHQRARNSSSQPRKKLKETGETKMKLVAATRNTDLRLHDVAL